MNLKWLCFHQKFVLKGIARRCKNVEFGAKYAKIALFNGFQQL